MAEPGCMFWMLCFDWLAQFIHPFSTTHPLQGHGGAGARPSIIVQRRHTPWTSCQLIAGPTERDKQPFTPTRNVNLAPPSRNQSTWTEPQQTQEEHETQEGLESDLVAVRGQC